MAGLRIKRLKLITFDVTDTLLNFKVSPAEKYSQVGAQFGVFVDSKDITANFKHQWRYMMSCHPNFGYSTGLGWKNWWREFVYRTFRETGKCNTVDSVILHKIGDRLIELFKTQECWKTAEGAHELLAHFKILGIPLGIISNYDERLETILKNMNLLHYFKFIITSYSAGFQKPDERIFQLALRQINNEIIKPDEALHVGNTPELDYIGAINAGWNAAIVHQNGKKIAEHFQNINPEHVFETLEDFQSFIIIQN